MKKIFYSLLIMALAGFSLSSCEDVPSPFDFPTKGSDTPTQTVDPAGSGTVADPYNVAAAIQFAQQLAAGEESASNIFIKGKIVSIREEYSAQYGNASFYISDDGTATNQFLVYRALYLNNKRWSEGNTQIQEGDEVVICGIVTNYNGTLETQQNKAYLYSLNGAGGGDVPTAEAKGSGTLEDPFNAVAANNEASKLASGQESDKDYYIKGKIAKIANNGEFSAQYGNASFYISDDGQDANTFYVFRALYLGNKKWTSGDTQIKVGDEVIICGRLTNYMGNTPETVANKSYIYSLNSTGGGGGGDTPVSGGTLDNPFTPEAANTYASSLASGAQTEIDYYIKGKIAKIANNGEFTAQYGNASFYISADGADNNTFYVFRTLYLGNRKWVDGDTQIKVGDEVIICGKLTNYMGNTPETVANQSYIYSLNGKSEGGSGGGGDTGDVKAVTIAEFNAAAVSDTWYQLSGTVKNLKDNDKYGNFDLEDATGSVYVYGLLSEKGGAKQQFQQLVAAKGIKNGTKITINGNRGDYNGKIEVVNAYFVSVDGQGGGDDPAPTGGGTYSNPYTVADAQAAGSGTGVYVKAYIVGNVDGQVYSSGAIFGTTGTQKTNLLIANSASETDPEKCMPVQLPSGAVRDALNLADNAGNYKKEVLLYGNIERYFGVTGLKTVTYAEIDGNAIGTKASAKRKARR